MELKDFIERALDALQQRYYRVLEGLTDVELAWQPCPNANSIGFIFWHVTRVEDRLVVHFAQGKPEVWIRDGWHQRWGIPEEITGLEYPPEQVTSFPIPELKEMQKYFEAVRQETRTFLQTIDTIGFEDCPPRTPYPESNLSVAFFQNFTVGHIFCQLIGEANQHLGQVAYIRGLQKNLDKS
ncbi:MAG: DinB family protein [Planctomycetota bacterium]|jgi:hypothetical protein